jgi:TonB family protein
MKFPKIKVPPPSGKEQKISLNLTQFTTPPPAPKPVVVPPQPKPVPPTPVVPPTPKPIVEKPVEETLKPITVVKKKLVENDKSTFVEKIETKENNVTKPKEKKEEVKKKKLSKKEPKKKELKKQKVKKEVKKKSVKKRVVKRKLQRKKSKNPLANALRGSGSSLYPTQSSPASSGSYSAKMINKLYGKEFNTYSTTQKNFIKKNLGLIHKITQRTLTRNGYPEISIRTRQQGTNIVSFYLHPNGDISNLYLKTKIGYAALDKNTLEVIRIAYKDYPLPNKKTKIVFYIQYSIY